MTIRVAQEGLHSCSGCEIAILNTGDTLLDILGRIDLVHMPILVDHKYFDSSENGAEINIPEADIGIISGSVATQEHQMILLEMRKKCETLIALGTCATHGGIPAMINQWALDQGIKSVFATDSTDSCTFPDEALPPFLDRVYALDEKVEIDICLPGCPPNPDHIGTLLLALINRTKLTLPTKSVCDSCPAIRKGKAVFKKVHRFFTNADYNPAKTVDDMRCLLEQGLMCMGPVTAAGCSHDGAPACILARVPCRGCFGPALHHGNQMLDMMNALVSNGVDFKSVADRKSLLRFSGARNLLRPIQVKGK